MIKTIIVDDERLARQELTKLLASFPEIEIIGDFAVPDDAIEKINDVKPDLIFLDIQMPGKTGFQLLEELEYIPEVIFTTAYDEYALKAFEINALDYILKPVNEDRLSEAVRKVLAKKLANQNIKTEFLTENDQVFVKDGEKCWFVQLSDIRLFESEGNYVRVYFQTSKPLILKSLNNLEKKLNPKLFFRASRKHIINLKMIESIENWFSGGLRVKLRGSEEFIEISRRQAAKLKDMMSL